MQAHRDETSLAKLDVTDARLASIDDETLTCELDADSAAELDAAGEEVVLDEAVNSLRADSATEAALLATDAAEADKEATVDAAEDAIADWTCGFSCPSALPIFGKGAAHRLIARLSRRPAGRHSRPFARPTRSVCSACQFASREHGQIPATLTQLSLRQFE